jgi:hypothetical protein
MPTIESGSGGLRLVEAADWPHVADGKDIMADAPTAAALPGVRALFQQRLSGDDALLRLAERRFREAGMPAEVYAENPDQLEYLLGYVPEHDTLPVVHLNRSADLLRQSGRDLIESFATRFAGRVAGLVVHDKASMAERQSDVVDTMRALGTPQSPNSGRPMVYLEYAAGLPVDRFAALSDQLADVELAALCIDIGHVAIKHARSVSLTSHSGAAWSNLSLTDPRLPEVADQVKSATQSALQVVLELIDRIGGAGKPMHFHLHDGHPLVEGLHDHFSFLTRFPVSFEVDGRCALPPVFGPEGLADVLDRALRACPTRSPSFTLEIHNVDGRLPLGAASELFTHWRDLTNAERMNYWLGVLADNHLLATAFLNRMVSADAG